MPGVRAAAAFLVCSIAFQFGLIVTTAQNDWFARLALIMALVILVCAAIALGALLEREGLT